MILFLQPSNRITRLPEPVPHVNILINTRGPLFKSGRMRLTPVVASIAGFLYGSFAAVLLHFGGEIRLAAGDRAEIGFAVVGEACDP